MEPKPRTAWTVATVALVVIFWCGAASCGLVLLADWVYTNVKMTRHDRP